MLKVQHSLLKTITDELRFVSGRMGATANPTEKLYFFSAAHGVLQRVFNIEFDPELVCAWQVLNAAHREMSGRLQAMSSGDHTVALPAILFDRLADSLSDLADCWETHRSAFEVLQRIAVLSYATTGNGQYLSIKGSLKF